MWMTYRHHAGIFDRNDETSIENESRLSGYVTNNVTYISQIQISYFST